MSTQNEGKHSFSHLFQNFILTSFLPARDKKYQKNRVFEFFWWILFTFSLNALTTIVSVFKNLLYHEYLTLIMLSFRHTSIFMAFHNREKLCSWKQWNPAPQKSHENGHKHESRVLWLGDETPISHRFLTDWIRTWRFELVCTDSEGFSYSLPNRRSASKSN